MKKNKKWLVITLSALMALTNISCATYQKEPAITTDASVQEQTTKSIEDNNQASSEENPNPWVWYETQDGDNRGAYHPYEALRNDIYYKVYEDHAEVDSYQPRAFNWNYGNLEISSKVDGRPVTKIRAGAFKIEIDSSDNSASRSSSLSTVIIPDSVTIIEDEAFKGNIYMCVVKLSENLVEIGNEAFFNCELLSEVAFPKCLKTIGRHAFYKCGLKTVILPDALESLGLGAFSFNQIEEVYIPDTLQLIEGNPFQDTPWMKKQTDEFVIVGDGVLLDYRGTQESVVVPDTVKRIVEPGFQLRGELQKYYRGELIAYPLLKRIEIPDTVVWIDEEIFYAALAENAIIRIPASVEHINDRGSYDRYKARLDSATIYCADHSCAQIYARKWGLNTKPIEEWPN